MAGHSKWSNIKHKKATIDQKRAKEFGKALREISVAAREGTDVNYNSRLAMAVANAQAINLPKENIQRAIQKQAKDGGNTGSQYIQIDFEGYDSSGLAYIVKMITSNKNRAVANARYGFTRFGGKLGTKGSVIYLFNYVGILYIDSKDIQKEQLITMLQDLDAHDFVELEGKYEIITSADRLVDSHCYLSKKYKIIKSGLKYHPINPIKAEKEIYECGLKIIDYFRKLDDVVDVFTNLELKDMDMKI